MKKYLLIIVISIVVILFFWVLRIQTRNTGLVKVLKECIGKEICIKQDSTTLIIGTLPLAHSNSYTIVHYIDSIGCTRCSLHLDLWESLIEELNKFSSQKVSLLFVTSIKDYNVLRLAFGRQSKYSVVNIVDTSSELLNKIISSKKIDILLLDENSKILTMGSPIKNREIRNRYYKLLRK